MDILLLGTQTSVAPMSDSFLMTSQQKKLFDVIPSSNSGRAATVGLITRLLYHQKTRWKNTDTHHSISETKINNLTFTLMGYVKKPSLKKFREVCDQYKGVISNIAREFGVSRKTIYDWQIADESFRDAIDEYKGQLLDECIKSARILALGIPKLNDKKQVVGWTERPDGYMLRYLMGTLGRREGYGENIDVTSNGKTIQSAPISIEIIDSRDKVAAQVTPGEEEEE